MGKKSGEPQVGQTGRQTESKPIVPSGDTGRGLIKNGTTIATRLFFADDAVLPCET